MPTRTGLTEKNSSKLQGDQKLQRSNFDIVLNQLMLNRLTAQKISVEQTVENSADDNPSKLLSGEKPKQPEPAKKEFTRKHRALIGKGVIDGVKVILAKPQTFMNLSGESIRELVDYYKVDEATELIVIYDDISLDVGQLRIRKKGSAGGHNGIKNIIAHLGHDVFMRVKVGVGEKPKGYDLADYVLGHFSKEEKEKMEVAYEKAVQAVRMAGLGEIDEAMNQFNRKG